MITEHPVVAQLSPEDLGRWRMLMARMGSYRESLPAHRDDYERGLIDEYRMTEEFIETYGLDPTRLANISTFTGHIWYSDFEAEEA